MSKINVQENKTDKEVKKRVPKKRTILKSKKRAYNNKEQEDTRHNVEKDNPKKHSSGYNKTSKRERVKSESGSNIVNPQDNSINQHTTDQRGFIDSIILENIGNMIRNHPNSKIEIKLNLSGVLSLNTVTNETSLILDEGMISMALPSPNQSYKVYHFRKTQYRYVRLMKPDIQESCVICLSKLKSKEIIANCECSHIFHYDCLKTWLSLRDYCPICRKGLIS